MDGKISKVQTLYKIVSDGSRGLDTDVKFNTNPSVSGIYTMNNTKDDKYPVHYYRGKVSNNNVLFAGFCWRVVRTTSTGGVKLIYNGVYDESNKCNNTGVNSQTGTSSFNSMDSSLAAGGYMYGIRYGSKFYSPGVGTVINGYYSYNSNYYYGDSISYSNGIYTLENATQKTWTDNYASLTGYYTCRSTSTTCSTVLYIVGTNSYYQNVIPLSNGITNPTTPAITLGKGATDNGDGTYSLTEVVTVTKKDWVTTYDSYKDYYICEDLISTICKSKHLIVSTDKYELYYDRTYKYVYGNDIYWDGSKYTLMDTFISTNSWSIDRTTLAKKYHYTCLNENGECNEIYYIYNFEDSSKIYYLTLSDGKDIENVKEEMFSNSNDSDIKVMIDSWYEENMTTYTEKLEDTIWCNDRVLYSGSLVGKDKEDDLDSSYFDTYNRNFISNEPSVVCQNVERDGFTVSVTSGGNGALTYPVGLLTGDEIRLSGGYGPKSYLYTGQNYWSFSPGILSQTNNMYQLIMSSGGFLYNRSVSNNIGVRPAISLLPGTRINGGDGTADNPYVIGDE